MVNEDVISMPDKWEYPWYAAWDLAFHTLPLSVVDPDFAKEQLELMLHGVYLHPSGQMPAYEWNFSDVNPPGPRLGDAVPAPHRAGPARRGGPRFPQVGVQQAAAELHLVGQPQGPLRQERLRGRLPRPGQHRRLRPQRAASHRRPPGAGGRHGLDGPLQPEHGWNSPSSSPRHDPIYEDMVLKFMEHFLYIAAAMNRPGQDGMWDEEDGFYYDLLRLPDGSATRLKVRSMVGLLPLCATTVIENWQRERIPQAMAQLHGAPAPDAGTAEVHPPHRPGASRGGRAGHPRPGQLRSGCAASCRRCSTRTSSSSPYGIRSLSKFHERHPYVLHVAGQEYRVDYLPAESNTGMFGGNSNWRGPSGCR